MQAAHTGGVPRDLCVLLVGLAALALTGCDGRRVSGGGSGCVAGASRACACENGLNGAQTCIDGQSFAACRCEPRPPDAAISDGSEPRDADDASAFPAEDDASAAGSDAGAGDPDVPDAGAADASEPDAGAALDALPTDALPSDGGAGDASSDAASGADGGLGGDAGVASDAGAPDAGVASDAGAADAGAADAGAPDAGAADSGAPDAGALDSGAPDAGPPFDGGQYVVALVRDTSLFLYGVTPGRPVGSTRLPTADAVLGGLAWSPGGTQIAFIRSAASGPEVCLYRIVGNTCRSGAPGDSVDWSHDGLTVASIDSTCLYIFETNSGAQRCFSSGTNATAGVTWSPVGNQLAYQRGDELWAWRPGYIATQIDTNVLAYAWLHDGNGLIAVRRSGSSCDIVRDAYTATSIARSVLVSGLSCSAGATLATSRDGVWLAFSYFDQAVGALYSLSLSNLSAPTSLSSLIPLRTTPAIAPVYAGLAFTPDSSYLGYVEQGTHLYLVMPNGGAPILVTANAGPGPYRFQPP